MRETSSRRVVMISTHGYVAAQPELGKPDTGGQVLYVLEVARCMARMGYEVDILTRQFEGQPSVETVQEGLRVMRFPCGGPDFVPKEVLCNFIPEWVSAAFRQLPPAYVDEVAFVNTHYWDAGLAGTRMAREWGLPHIHTPHSLGVWKRDSMPGEPSEKERRYNFRRRITEERRIYNDATMVVATTPQQSELLSCAEYEVRPSKIAVIPPGFDDTRFYPVSAASRQVIKRQLGLEGKIVLAVGRMARNKGYDLLIKAMLPVLERVPDARLVLAVGASHLTPDEKTQLAGLRDVAAGLGWPDRVVFRDYIPEELLPNYYRAADVFALSSRYEPFGMTAVEAMACGTPTVITTEGGLWQQVTWGDEALYADPNDTDSFGHAMCRPLVYSEIAARLAENGARKARAYFTWTAVTQQLMNGVMDEVGTGTHRVPTAPRSSNDFRLMPTNTS